MKTLEEDRGIIWSNIANIIIQNESQTKILRDEVTGVNDGISFLSKKVKRFVEDVGGLRRLLDEIVMIAKEQAKLIERHGEKQVENEERYATQATKMS